MKKNIQFLAIALVVSVSAQAAVDCAQNLDQFKSRLVADKAMVLELVSKEIAASPTCSCEVVKAAIEISQGDAKLVASIVEAAALAAPDQIRLISQCAIAVAPDSISDVQSVVSKLDPGAGDSSVKDSKGGVDSKNAAPSNAPASDVGNPLDFPGYVMGVPNSINAPTGAIRSGRTGGQGGNSVGGGIFDGSGSGTLTGPGSPVIPVPPINVAPVTFN